MTGLALPVAMLAARLALHKFSSAALDVARQRWNAWIAGISRPAAVPTAPCLTLCIHVCCHDDIVAYVGAMELLEHFGAGAELLLITPTPSAATQLQEQALREGWAGLAMILPIAESLQLVEAMPASRTIMGYLLPSGLSDLQRKALPDLLPAEHCFVGPGSGFRSWVAGRSHCTSAQLDAVLIELIASCDAGHAAGPKRAAPRDEAITIAGPESGAAPLEAIHEQGRLRLPSPQIGDFLQVSVHLQDSGSATILRRTIVAPDERFAVQMPPSRIGVVAQPLRIDVIGGGGTARSESFALRIHPERLEPWMLGAYLNRGGAGNPVIRAFAQGTGSRLAYAEDQEQQLADIPVVWGVLRGSDRVIAQARQRGGYWFYIDHAYFNRGHGKSYRITRNAYEAGQIRRCPANRAEELNLKLMPWRRAGRHIIVCPPTDYFMQAHDCADWLPTTLGALRGLTDRPVIVREKPVSGQASIPLIKALWDAHALVTHSSNVAIEAACLGTPVFVAASSAAAPIGQTDLTQIETPVYPDRQPWVQHLAYSQFSIEEFASGAAWRMLIEFEGRPHV